VQLRIIEDCIEEIEVFNEAIEVFNEANELSCEVFFDSSVEIRPVKAVSIEISTVSIETPSTIELEAVKPFILKDGFDEVE